jgi:hypothetical protein
VQEIREQGLGLEPLWYGWGMPRNAPEGGDKGYRSFGVIRGDFGSRKAGAEGGEWISYGIHASWADAIEPREVSDAERLLRDQDETPVLVAGGFPNINDDEILNHPYPPESATAGAEWKTNRLLPGRRVDFGHALQTTDGAPALAYAMQYVWSPAAADVYLSAGHQGGLQGWINDDAVLRVHGAHRPTGDDASRGLGRLNAGWNRLLLKAESFTDDNSVQFRVTGVDGQPIAGLRFSAQPGGVAESGGR